MLRHTRRSSSLKTEWRSVPYTVAAISHLLPCHRALVCHFHDRLCHICQFVGLTFNRISNWLKPLHLQPVIQVSLGQDSQAWCCFKAGPKHPGVFSRSGLLIKPLSILTPSKWKEASALSAHVSSTPTNKDGRFQQSGIPTCGLFSCILLQDS